MTGAASSRHTSRYRPGAQQSDPDGRLYSPVFLRNSPPLIATLARLFDGLSGPVLEIGAGTGQHAAAFSLAFPSLDWHPSDLDPVHRRSVAAWAKELRAPGLPPLDIDAGTGWAELEPVRRLGPLTAVVCLNVTHIAPFAVTEGLIAGAAQTLAPGGRLLIYGPFLRGGLYSGDGDRAFDAGLRAENPDWGLRDTDNLQRLARDAALAVGTEVTLPANNLLLVFEKPL